MLQAELEKERQRLAEEKARKEAEEAKRLAAQQKAEAEARRKAEEEARRAATLSDVPEDVEFEDDEFGDFGDEDDRGGWTELVK